MLEEDRVEAQATLDGTVQGALRDLNLDSSASTSQPASRPSKLGQHRASVASPSSHSAYDPQDSFVDLVDGPVRRLDHDGFRPIAGFKFSSSSVDGAPSSKTCLAMSDIGFLAAANDANLLVADMRGPDVLLFDGPHSQTVDHKGKGKHRADNSSISSLTWTITAIGEGKFSLLRFTQSRVQTDSCRPQTEIIHPDSSSHTTLASLESSNSQISEEDGI